MPSKSQMALALELRQQQPYLVRSGAVRLRVDLVEKTASVVLVEDTCETPRMILEWLDVLDLHQKNVPWLGALDFEGSGEVVNLSQIHILDVVGTIVVPNLPSCPVETFNLDNFSIFDGSTERD